ncbi:hypothetical protein GLAREA_01234 [Glarea lozoyensis ATCC 20868]|uniref:Rhodopsin domain-containing protein n=1 Tax=Glarea lozoyensis (strain ATCC 20868 / MF5171) TaxID=1116229 RepID=S3CFR2_GLAL2|nr:uncharacterized protein GLAREA_01234 [Glarea lozoyensis ATCC 20868]EPE25322.1 hypothetical protein GLAREA_01234 [Glarea lozoyensis ATCC 20868]
MGDKRPPFFRLTDDDHGGVGVVAALSTIIISLAVSGIRGVVAARQRVGFRGDDVTFYVASFLAVSSSICLYRAVLSGLGKRMNNLTPQEIESFYTLVYTSHLLAILSMTFSKISVVMLLKRIAQSVSSRFNFCLIIVTIWGTFSFFAIAFQCQLPNPWMYVPSKCNTKGYLQYPVIGLNILTDILLGTAILPTIWKLNVARATRVTVMVLFGLRLVVSLLAIVELISVANSLASPDQSWVSLSRFIWMILVTHTSLITATIPRTHSFWASLQTGKASTAITDQEYELSSPQNSRQYASARIRNFITSSRNHTISRNHTPRSKGAEPLSSREGSRNSNEPLRLVPLYEARLGTRVYSDRGERGRQRGREGEGGVWRESEFAVEVEYVEGVRGVERV